MIFNWILSIKYETEKNIQSYYDDFPSLFHFVNASFENEISHRNSILSVALGERYTQKGNVISEI